MAHLVTVIVSPGPLAGGIFFVLRSFCSILIDRKDHNIEAVCKRNFDVNGSCTDCMILQAEQALIASLVLDASRIPEAASMVGAEDFFSQKNREIFSAIFFIQEERFDGRGTKKEKRQRKVQKVRRDRACKRASK